MCFEPTYSAIFLKVLYFKLQKEVLKLNKDKCLELAGEGGRGEGLE